MSITNTDLALILGGGYMKAFADDTQSLANANFEGDQLGALRYMKKAPPGAYIQQSKPGWPKLVKTLDGEIHGYIYKGKYITMNEWAEGREDTLDKIMKDIGLKL